MQIGSRSAQVTVGTDSVVLSEAKLNGYSERIRLIVTNISTGGQVISVSVDGDAKAGAGLVLSAGGFVSWDKTSADFPLQQNRVTAIASAAGATVAVYEEVINRGF